MRYVLAAVLATVLLPDVASAQKVSYNPTLEDRVTTLEREVVNMRGQIARIQTKLGEYPNNLSGVQMNTVGGVTVERQVVSPGGGIVVEYHTMPAGYSPQSFASQPYPSYPAATFAFPTLPGGFGAFQGSGCSGAGCSVPNQPYGRWR